MATYFTRQVETVKGVNFGHLCFFNSNEDLSNNSFIDKSHRDLTNEECIYETEQSYYRMKYDINSFFNGSKTIHVSELPPNEDVEGEELLVLT